MCCVTVFLFFSCQQQKEPRQFKIGFSQCGDADAWRKSMLDEMNRELAFHPELQLIYKQADDNSLKQVQQVRELLNEKIDLLIISPNEAEPLTPIVEEVYQSGIPVIVVDRKIASTSFNNYIGADNYQIGKMAGLYVAGLLKEKGSIIEITGLPASSPAMERRRGFSDGIAAFPGLTISKVFSGDWVKPVSQQKTTALKEVLPTTQLIFAHNDVMALGAWEATRKEGFSHIKVIGVDALPGKNAGMEYVANGILSASMLYPTGGTESIRNAARLLNKQPLPKESILQTLVVDSSNVRMMKLQSDKILSQQEDIEQQQIMLREQRRIYNNQRTSVYILAGTLALILVFASLLFYSRQLNRKINRRLAMQNEEISRQSAQLVEMSAKAEAANEAKLNFFTNISHEFRTPLTLIIGPAEEMLKAPRLQPTAKQQLTLLHKNAVRLLRLVNQLIDFRKIEFNKMKVKAVPCDLVSFTDEVVEVFQDTARKRNIDCRLLTSERSLPVWIDVNMMDQVLFNLLSNAFKFTPDNGSIVVRVEKDTVNNRALLHVEDNGTGMSEEEQAHAFELFYQGDHDNHKGSGLGLALSKELVAIHHGTISVSGKKGKGSCFTVAIPLGKEHFSAHQCQDQEWVKTTTEEAHFHGADLYPVPEINTEEEDTYTEKEARILLVEDNPELRQFLKMQLLSRFEIIEAENGITGIQKAFDHLPDLIVCDVMMPGKDGITLTSQLKNDVRTAHIPIVLLTAKAATDQQLEGMRNMADAYMVKPFNFSVLEQTLSSLLANRVRLKEYFSSAVPTSFKTNGSKVAERKFVSSFKAIVEHNIANDAFSVEDICREMNLSKIQLYRKVKSLLGTNINEYILACRVNKARYYLQHEDLSIAEVAYKTGFSTPAYFSTVFKSKTGISPTNFRANPEAKGNL
ncbi:MAG: hybrid sensor histidine kinase/response regulator transcription factor [Chitinophagaceae bacterium]